jgi:hypothetical protein
VQPDSIRFNFKTKKALIWIQDRSGEFKIKAAITKKKMILFTFKRRTIYNIKTLIILNIIFKLIKSNLSWKSNYRFNKYGYCWCSTNSTTFAIFLWVKRLIYPESYYLVTTTQIQRFSLQNGGYYFALSDNMTLTILGDYYTNGSYGLRFESSMQTICF